MDCRLCTRYRGKHSCDRLRCPWLLERIEAGTVSYEEALAALFNHRSTLYPRIRRMLQSGVKSIWLEPEHRWRMEVCSARQTCRRRRDKSRYAGAVYLLTATPELTERTKECFWNRAIHFQCVLRRGIGIQDYTLLSAARGIYQGKGGLTVSELMDPEIVDDTVFQLVVNGLLIAAYGSPALQLERGEVLR